MSAAEDERRDRARHLADELIDYAVYAPLGAAMTVADQLPELVRRGRERFGGRVKLAQVLGKVAVDQARRQAEGFVRGPARQSRPEPPRPDERPAKVSAAVEQAIPGYDDLGASEVVSRLSSLSPAELQAVREHELAHRGRRTILGRIAQLLDGRSN